MPESSNLYSLGTMALAVLKDVTIGLATEATYDYITGSEIAPIDEDGKWIESPVVNLPIDENASWQVQARQDAASDECEVEMVLKNPDGVTVTRQGFYHTGSPSGGAPLTGSRKALAEAMDLIYGDPIGQSKMKELPVAVKDSAVAEDNEQQFDEAESYAQRAAQAMIKNRRVATTPKLRREVNGVIGSQDGSRISKEYHEYVYCIVDSGDWTGVQAYAPNYHLEYENQVDSEQLVPTHGEWIDLEPLRDAFKLFRRIKRARGQCGGKALWEFQGFANKQEAIIDDYQGTAEIGDIMAALAAASPNFSLVANP